MNFITAVNIIEYGSTNTWNISKAKPTFNGMKLINKLPFYIREEDNVVGHSRK